jgi:hypothetical protein
MPCGCNGAVTASAGSSGQWEVTLPNGEKRILPTEHDANIARTVAGGGTVRKL